MNQDAGASLRLKYQITSIEGDRSTGTIRKFVDNALLARDSNQLRSYIALVTPDVDMKTTITFKDSTDLLINSALTPHNLFQPASTVSTHSVSSRKVIQGTLK